MNSNWKEKCTKGRNQFIIQIEHSNQNKKQMNQEKYYKDLLTFLELHD